MEHFDCRYLAVFIVLMMLMSWDLTCAADKSAKPYRLILPKTIPAVVGHEVNIYFDNVVLCPDSHQLIFDVNCSKGLQQSERWTFIPQASDIGNIPLAIDILDANCNIIESAKTTIQVIPADTGAQKNASFLIIGDSLTHASVYPEEILTLCSTPGNPSLNLIGTHHIGGTSSGNRHEGYGGWTFERFVTFYSEDKTTEDLGKRSSPFMFMENGKPVFDFKRYIKEQAEGKFPDFVSIELGCNDIFGASEVNQQSIIDRALGFADILVKAILDADANTKVGLVMLPPPAASQDAFGYNYGCGQTRWQYRRNQHRFIEQLTAIYGNREKERIYLIPAHTGLDTIHGFPTESVPANARTADTVLRHVNGVHPNASGYKQMADSIYAWMKSMLLEQ